MIFSFKKNKHTSIVKRIDVLEKYNRLKGEALKLSKKYSVTVGIHAQEGATKVNGKTLAQIGAINHFGAENIPARPFLDVALEDKRVKKRLNRAFRQGFRKDNSVPAGLNALGQIAANEITQYILKLDAPPNAPKTIQRKGKDDPLVDTGRLARSITHKLNKKR